MTYYVDIIDKTTCLGNSLSTINFGLSSLDNNLHGLSAYLDQTFSQIYTDTQYLSSSIDTNYSTLYSTITTVSANSPTFARNSVYQTPDGIVNLDFGINNSNTVVTLSTNGFVNNISNIGDGEYGKLLVKISPLTSVSITGWGNQWTFNQNLSTMNINMSAQNLINYYYDDQKILAQLLVF
jgi:hypothetical protein